MRPDQPMLIERPHKLVHRCILRQEFREADMLWEIFGQSVEGGAANLKREPFQIASRLIEHIEYVDHHASAVSAALLK
jgi:hypothetical protein